MGFFELKEKIKRYYYYNGVYVKTWIGIIILILIIFLWYLLFSYLKTPKAITRDPYWTYGDGYDYEVNYKNPADEWMKNFQNNKWKVIAYKGINILIEDIKASDEVKSVASQETLDKLIDFVKEKGINDENTLFTLGTDNWNPAYKGLLTLSITSNDKKRDIDEIRKRQEKIVEEYPLKNKEILMNTFNNQMDRYIAYPRSFADYFHLDTLTGNLRNKNSWFVILWVDYPSMIKLLGEKSKKFIQNDGMIAHKARVLNMDEYINDNFTLDNIYTLNGYLMLYPETARFNELLAYNSEIKKDFFNYIEEWLKVAALSDHNNDIKNEKSDMLDAGKQLITIWQTFQNNFRVLHWEKIEQFIKDKILKDSEKEIMKKFDTEEKRKEIAEYILQGKQWKQVVVEENKDWKIVSNWRVKDYKPSDIEKYLTIQKKVNDLADVYIALFGNFPNFTYTYLLNEELENKELTDLIMSYLAKYEYSFAQEDLPTLNYESQKTFKPFIFDVLNNQVLSAPQNDTLDILGDNGDYTGDKFGFNGVVKKWPSCSRIDTLLKNYQWNKGVQRMEREFGCSSEHMLFNYYTIFTGQIYSKASDFFKLIEWKEPANVSLVAFNTFVKIYPDVLIWRFSKASDRQKFYEDFNNYLLTKQFDLYMSKYYTYFKSYKDYEKLHENITVITNILWYHL